MRILVVDRDPTVASACERAFRDEHEVVALTSGMAALERIAIGRAFDLILLELSLPDVTGQEVYRRLADCSPRSASRIVFITEDVKAAHEFLQSVKNMYVQKPIAASALRELLRDATRK